MDERVKELERERDEHDQSATQWAHMYNDLFHLLEPWLRKRACFLREHIQKGEGVLARDFTHEPWMRVYWESSMGDWRKALPDLRAELAAIDAALSGAPLRTSTHEQECACGKPFDKACVHSMEMCWRPEQESTDQGAAVGRAPEAPLNPESAVTRASLPQEVGDGEVEGAGVSETHLRQDGGGQRRVGLAERVPVGAGSDRGGRPDGGGDLRLLAEAQAAQGGEGGHVASLAAAAAPEAGERCKCGAVMLDWKVAAHTTLDEIRHARERCEEDDSDPDPAPSPRPPEPEGRLLTFRVEPRDPNNRTHLLELLKIAVESLTKGHKLTYCEHVWAGTVAFNFGATLYPGTTDAEFLTALPEGPPDPAPAAASAVVEALVEALRGWVRLHEEDGCCGPGTAAERAKQFGDEDSEDYCDLCVASHIALDAAALLPEKPSEARAASAGEGLRSVLERLVKRLEFVHASDAYKAVWTISQLHVGPYQGPSYLLELEEARTALAPAQRED